MSDVARDTWPLEIGDTLSNHDWWPFKGHQFLASKLVSRSVMTGNRAALGTAMILLAEAMRQDPAGTLPADDIDLAALARFGRLDEWLACRDEVLKDWVAVIVTDPRTGEAVTRWGNVVLLLDVVEDMHRRKRGRDGAREAARLAVRKTRIRKKMAEIQSPKHMIENDQVVHLLAEFFAESDLYITPDNLRTAMAQVIGYGGEVTPLVPKVKGGEIK